MFSCEIINGDCITELKKIESASIDLIFADPPYWMRVSGILKRTDGSEFDGCQDEWDQFDSLDDYENFTFSWLSECYRVLKPSGSIWVIGSMQCIYMIGYCMQKIGFWFINDVVWHKKNPTPNFAGTRLNNSHETLIWATKSAKSKFTFNYKTAKELNTDNVSELDFSQGKRKQLGSVWKIGICIGNERLKDENGYKIHSTQKPQELLYKIINISSSIGDVILDPFGGTMTTGAIAKLCGRNFIGIEKSEKYCLYGLRRIENIKEEIGDIEKAVFDEKPLKVTLEEMIQYDFLFENEYLFLGDKITKVILQKNGKVVLESGEITNIHEAVAKVKNLKVDRVNGFDYWFVKRDDKYVPLKTIRETYRASKKVPR